MKPLRIAQDIVPLAEFKAQSASWLERMRVSGHAVVITQNGKPAAVMISPEEYDRFQQQNTEFVRNEIRYGEASAEQGRLLTAADVKAEFSVRRKTRTPKK